MSATPVGAVVFDWGGTLALPMAIELIDLWRVAATALDPDRAEAITETLVGIEQAAWAKTETTMRSARLMDLLREASDELELDVAEAVLRAAHDAHLDAWTPSIRHHPAAQSVLRSLRDAGLAIGLLSNTHWPRSYHEHFLARDGLADLIDARVYTSEIDWIKPHPQPFADVARQLDTPESRCVYVGDRPIDDIRGANDAGMRSVWIRNDYAPGWEDAAAQAAATIDDLADLPAVVAAWRAV